MGVGGREGTVPLPRKVKHFWFQPQFQSVISSRGLAKNVSQRGPGPETASACFLEKAAFFCRGGSEDARSLAGGAFRGGVKWLVNRRTGLLEALITHISYFLHLYLWSSFYFADLDLWWF